METRLLWKRPIGAGSWYFTTYRWSDDGETSTSELTTGQLFGADAGAASGYEIPAQTNCYDCHGGRFDAALGFEAVALSSPGASGVTMATLTAGDLLTDPPAAPIVIPGDAATAAALGYLHMNCGTSCHNRDNGEAANKGLYLRLDVATLASAQTTDTFTTGIGGHPLYPVTGVTLPEIFTPCDPDDSAGYYRMNHRDGVDGTPTETQMPPIVSHKVDPDGVALVAAWLNSFPQCTSATTP
jgi:hypothetical protein